MGILKITIRGRQPDGIPPEEYRVSAAFDSKFIGSHYCDCVTKERIVAGHVVVVCAHCKLTGIYLKENWSGTCMFARQGEQHVPMEIKTSLDHELLHMPYERAEAIHLVVQHDPNNGST